LSTGPEGMAHPNAWIERLATSRYCVLKSSGASLAIVIIGIGVFWRALPAVVRLRHLGAISFDPREDLWFRVSFVAPAALTLLVLAGFLGPLCVALVRRRRYWAFVGTLAWGTVIASSFVFVILLAWRVY
jgi:hypothetical protein